MNAPLVEPLHSPFGGSSAARVLRCPASVGLVEKVPPDLRKPSVYADRGTALHAAMANLLDDSGHSIGDFVGETLGGYAVTNDDVENFLRPAYNYVGALLDQPGAEYYLEHRVVFPGVANTFGTVDLLIRIGRAIYVIDFKFGAGVRVLAVRPDGDEDLVNPQLAFYAAAARSSLPEFFTGVRNITLTIVQPQSIETDAEMVSAVTVTQAELDEFVTIYRAACEEALAPAPHLERGAWCRFCAARPICPLHAAPLLNLAQFAVPAPLAYGGAFAAPEAKEAYLKALAHGLDLVDAIKDIRTALHDQAKHALQCGDPVPGYTLSAGRAERHWYDESAALAALTEIGLARSDVIAEAMRSPKQVEIRAKARGLKIPQELIVSSRSGVSLTRAENVRVPVPRRDEIARSFSEALKAFLKGE